MTHQVAVWNQQTFAWYTDAGGEGTNQIGTTGSNPTTLDTNTQYRLRYLIQETAGSTVAETPVFGLEFRVDAAGGTSFGAWTAITSGNAAFTAVSTASVTDGATTTQQIGAGTFNDGEFSYVDAGSTAPTNTLTATGGSDEYEVEWVLEFAAVGGQNFEFRVIWDDGTTPPATALDTYTATTQVSPSAPVNTLLADNVSSASAVSSPAAVITRILDATNVQSASTVSTTAILQTHILDATNVQSASTVSDAAIIQTHIIGAATSAQSASNVSNPTLVANSALGSATSVQSASNVSSPVTTQTYVFTATNVQSASAVSTTALSQDIERLPPDGDDVVGSWTTDLGGSTNLFQSIDEDPFNDSDYVQSELSPQSSVARFTLTNPSGAVDIASDHKVQYRYYKELDAAGVQQLDLVVRLKQGASTVVATWTHSNITGTVVQAVQTLSAGQVSAITNYADLRLEFDANAP